MISYTNNLLLDLNIGNLFLSPPHKTPPHTRRGFRGGGNNIVNFHDCQLNSQLGIIFCRRNIGRDVRC